MGRASKGSEARRAFLMFPPSHEYGSDDGVEERPRRCHQCNLEGNA